MDALTVLRREHTRIKQLFVEFDALSECACVGRRALMREIDQLVRRHIDVEEALVYAHVADPAAQADDHRTVVRFLDNIAATDCRDPLYVARAQALRDVLARHINEEETVVFPAFSARAGSSAA